MKTLLALLVVLTTSVFSQTKELEINLELLPGLVPSFKNIPINIEVSSNRYKYDTTIVNTTNVVFKNMSDDHKSIFIYATINCSDSIAQKHFLYVVTIDSLLPGLNKKTITFPFNCAINTYTGGKVCPKCKKNDQVIPIIWGLPDPSALKGEVGIDFDLGGCVRKSYCEADWHCKRDETDF